MEKDAPKFGKQYKLTGGTGEKAISNGNTWAESEVTPPGKNYSGVSQERAVELLVMLINDALAKTNNPTARGEWIEVKKVLYKMDSLTS